MIDDMENVDTIEDGLRQDRGALEESQRTGNPRSRDVGSVKSCRVQRYDYSSPSKIFKAHIVYYSHSGQNYFVKET